MYLRTDIFSCVICTFVFSSTFLYLAIHYPPPLVSYFLPHCLVPHMMLKKVEIISQITFLFLQTVHFPFSSFHLVWMVCFCQCSVVGYCVTCHVLKTILAHSVFSVAKRQKVRCNIVSFIFLFHSSVRYCLSVCLSVCLFSTSVFLMLYCALSVSLPVSLHRARCQIVEDQTIPSAWLFSCCQWKLRTKNI